MGEAHDNSGPVRCETKHNQHRRSFWHDYYQKGLYMVTMVIEGRKPLFGIIVGHANGRPGTDEAPHILLSELGRRVFEEEVSKISRYYPMVEVWRVAMMPDHIHLLLWVREPLPKGKHLGMVIRGFKTGCSRAWWQWQDETALGGKTPSTVAAVPKASPPAAVPKAFPLGKKELRPVLFEKGYHDRIINRSGMLENIKRYMQENPLRARIREECPRLMERQLHLWIGGREYAAFGNLFLLKYPIKEQVFFHRKDPQTGQPTELTEAYRQEHARLLRIAEEGTVLVTPGISKGESLVVNDALDARLPLILLQKEPIGKYWKPPQRRFYACAAGHLLILAPWVVDGATDYSRFHQLNDYAREICEATEMRILNYSDLKA
jgi:REP element-mobilizing transposase RayT